MTFLQPDIYTTIEGMANSHRHTDRCLLSQKEDAQFVFSWFESLMDPSHGVYILSGMVRDRAHRPVPGGIIDAGATHFGISDKRGHDVIEGIVEGPRTLQLAIENDQFSSATRYELRVDCSRDSLNFLVN